MYELRLVDDHEKIYYKLPNEVLVTENIYLLGDFTCCNHE